MSLKELTSKYIRSAEKVLKEIKRVKGTISVDEDGIDRILRYVTNYLADAKYYNAQRKFETSLTSIAYCEGLLDALKLLGAVEFEWSKNMKSDK